MSIRYYDTALTEKIKGWVKDPKTKVLSPNDSTRFFQMHADEINDEELTLPLIALSRDTSMKVSTAKKPLSYDGAKLGQDAEKIAQLNAINIELSYQLDIYTRYFAEADEYMRNFLFNLINYPKVSIEIPYNNAKIKHDSTLIVDPTVSDNSEIPERVIKGQFYRMSIKFKIDDAYLFSVPFKHNWEVEFDGIEIKEN